MTIDFSNVNQNIAKPMDLRTIEQNIDDFVYRCYEAFLANIKWVQHNFKLHLQLSMKKAISLKRNNKHCANE